MSVFVYKNSHLCRNFINFGPLEIQDDQNRYRGS